MASVASSEPRETHVASSGSSDSSVTDKIDSNKDFVLSLAFAKDVVRLKRKDSEDSLQPALILSQALYCPAIKESIPKHVSLQGTHRNTWQPGQHSEARVNSGMDQLEPRNEGSSHDVGIWRLVQTKQGQTHRHQRRDR
ncbi:hypothetical protein FSOLCH5_15492 [Fusarium solani]